jgi:hypothetical protein
MAIAKIPTLRAPNLRILGRAGVNDNGTALWLLACRCKRRFTASTTSIKNGEAKCWCMTTHGKHVMAILPHLPATRRALCAATGLTMETLHGRLKLMRKNHECHVGGWARAKLGGSYQPVYHDGPGEDVACPFDPLPHAVIKQRSEERARAAILLHQATGEIDPRHERRIRYRTARQVLVKLRRHKQPQHPFSALGV